MRPKPIVLPEPCIDDGQHLSGRMKPLGIERLSTQCSFETFFETFLPRRTWRDLDRLDPDLSQPVLQSRRDELRTID